MSQANIDRLIKEGLLEKPTDEERKKLDKLTDEEVSALISIKAKLGGEIINKARIKPQMF